MTAGIDRIIRSSLSSLADHITHAGWSGRRERELVSLFCFGHLLRCCEPSTFLRDPTQIGIEVAVPQTAGQKNLTGRSVSKRVVCKDIVIWPEPGMTCWTAAGAPAHTPSAIIEWKHNDEKGSDFDVEWLKAFSEGVDGFVGFAVRSELRGNERFELMCTRVHKGRVEAEWLSI